MCVYACVQLKQPTRNWSPAPVWEIKKTSISLSRWYRTNDQLESGELLVTGFHNPWSPTDQYRGCNNCRLFGTVYCSICKSLICDDVKWPPFTGGFWDGVFVLHHASTLADSLGRGFLQHRFFFSKIMIIKLHRINFEHIRKLDAVSKSHRLLSNKMTLLAWCTIYQRRFLVYQIVA